MENVAIENNPFYLLRLSCSAGRRQILAAAEEAGFRQDPRACEEAQSQLTNPGRRLSAELGWFPELEGEGLGQVCGCIARREPIATDGLSPLSALNRAVYNLTISQEQDRYLLGYEIWDISGRYDRLDAGQIAGQLNRARQSAGLAGAEQAQVEAGLRARRQEIRQVLGEILDRLPEDAFTELACLLVCRYEALEGAGGALLLDALDRYEMRFQDKLEEGARRMKALADRIRELERGEEQQLLEELSQLVCQWQGMAQPLQMRGKATGMPHPLSEQVGMELRNLAIFLCNEKDLVEPARDLVGTLMNLFEDLPELWELLRKDNRDLEEILADRRLRANLEQLRRQAEALKQTPSDGGIRMFLGQVQALDEQIGKEPLSLAKQLQRRIDLCALARNLAVTLHNEKNCTDYALLIAQKLQSEFGGVKELSDRLLQDLEELQKQQTNQAAQLDGQSWVKQTIVQMAAGFAGLAFMGLLIFLCVLLFSGPSKQDQPEVRYSADAEYGDPVYADIVYIFPKIGIYEENSSFFCEFACQCRTTSGETVWLHLTTQEYKDSFDSSITTYKENDGVEGVEYPAGTRIHGVVKRAESVLDGLSEDTGEKLIEFTGVS